MTPSKRFAWSTVAALAVGVAALTLTNLPTPAAPGPYPECVLVAEWLTERAIHPDGFRILEWGTRTEGPAGVTVLVRYQDGKATFRQAVLVRDGQVAGREDLRIREVIAQ
jgi:hypothetical protein